MAVEPTLAADSQAEYAFLPDDPPPPLPRPHFVGRDVHGGCLLVLPALLSPAECARITAACAPLSREHTFERLRSIVASPSLSAAVLARLHGALAAAEAGAADGGGGEGAEALRAALLGAARHGSTWVAEALHPIWRFVAYKEGGRLGPHLDDTTRCTVDSAGLHTAMAYLSEGYGGGELRLLQAVGPGGGAQALNFCPRAGDFVLLDRRVLHEALAVRAGPGGELKTFIRTELRCVRVPPLAGEADRAAEALLAQAERAPPQEAEGLRERAFSLSPRLEGVFLNL
jgi:hypothetical protein